MYSKVPQIVSTNKTSTYISVNFKITTKKFVLLHNFFFVLLFVDTNVCSKQTCDLVFELNSLVQHNYLIQFNHFSS